MASNVTVVVPSEVIDSANSNEKVTSKLYIGLKKVYLK